METEGVIPLESMPLYHLAFIACAWITGEKIYPLSTHWTMGISHQDILTQILWNFYFFLLMSLKIIENPDFKNENRRPPSRQE